MTTYTTKENKTLDKISKVLNDLDNNLVIIENIEKSENKNYSIKKHIAERKAIHEVKKIMHDINKYDRIEKHQRNASIDNYNNQQIKQDKIYEDAPYIEKVLSEDYGEI